eukprot:2435828-Pyramimonas_sp.AAC.1
MPEHRSQDFNAANQLACCDLTIQHRATTPLLGGPPHESSQLLQTLRANERAAKARSMFRKGAALHQ